MTLSQAKSKITRMKKLLREIELAEQDRQMATAVALDDMAYKVWKMAFRTPTCKLAKELR